MSSSPPDIEETLPHGEGAGLPAAPRSWSALLVAMCCDDVRQPPSRHSLEGVSAVHVGRGVSRRMRREGASLHLDLPDAWASSAHARFVREGRRFRVEDLGSTNGLRVNGMRRREAWLADSDLIEVGHTLLYYRRYEDEAPPALPDTLQQDVSESAARVATLSPAFARGLADAFRVAESSDLPLLIEGESGSGKEVLATALARASRREGPFVPVNCGAIVPSLVESELFGHQRGAFTGANSNHEGLIRSAHCGTLFLDEIGDLGLGAQAALLRVLQEREVRPIGSTRAVPVDVRLLSATHRDLDALSGAGSFRDDLLARLSGFRVRLLPLRQRREDLGLLVAALLRSQQGAATAAVRFEPEAAARLFYYDWPLNVRELGNVLTAARVLAGEGAIAERHLPSSLRAAEPDQQVSPAARTPSEDAQRAELVELFRRHRGNVSAVARDMGKARTQVQRWVKRFGLNPREFQN